MRELVHKENRLGTDKEKGGQGEHESRNFRSRQYCGYHGKNIEWNGECKGICSGSRSLEKAQAFAEKNQVEKAYGSYEALFADPEVELIYVAVSAFASLPSYEDGAGRPGNRCSARRHLRQTLHRQRKSCGCPRRKVSL